jgi:hypothetical protein
MLVYCDDWFVTACELWNEYVIIFDLRVSFATILNEYVAIGLLGFVIMMHFTFWTSVSPFEFIPTSIDEFFGEAYPPQGNFFNQQPIRIGNFF